MDYTTYSKGDYFTLLSQFDNISTVLTEKLVELEGQGYNPSNGFMFGFSFGAQLVLEAGRRFGYRKLEEIDGILRQILIIIMYYNYSISKNYKTDEKFSSL